VLIHWNWSFCIYWYSERKKVEWFLLACFCFLETDNYFLFPMFDDSTEEVASIRNPFDWLLWVQQEENPIYYKLLTRLVKGTQKGWSHYLPIAFPTGYPLYAWNYFLSFTVSLCLTVYKLSWSVFLLWLIIHMGICQVCGFPSCNLHFFLGISHSTCCQLLTSNSRILLQEGS
jgi:hypothetical protein